jgi:hypothetical protein
MIPIVTQAESGSPAESDIVPASSEIPADGLSARMPELQ